MSASEVKREGFWNLKQTVCYQPTRVRPSKKGWDVALNPFAAHPTGSEGAGLSRFWAIPVAAQADVSPVLLQSFLPSHSSMCPSPLQRLTISSLLSSVPQPELPAPQLCKTMSATQGCVVEHCPLPKIWVFLVSCWRGQLILVWNKLEPWFLLQAILMFPKTIKKKKRSGSFHD